MTSDYQRAPAAARSTSTKCARPRFCRNFFILLFLDEVQIAISSFVSWWKKEALAHK